MKSITKTTISANKQTVSRNWHIVDAEGMILGRMCSKIASILKGKHKPSYTPHVDTGDFVIVVNADKIRLTGSKMDQKVYLTYSGYPGGQKTTTARALMAKKPTAMVEKSVRGMLPKNKLGRAMLKKLFVYQGGEHPHEAQKPEPLKIER